MALLSAQITVFYGMARRTRKPSPRWIPSFHTGSHKWRVVIPARWSETNKQRDKYFDSKASAERFIAAFLAEREEYGKQAVTIEERRWLGYWKERVGDLSMMPVVVGFWKRSGEQLQQIPAIEGAKQYLEAVEADYTNKRTWGDVEQRIRHFAMQFGPMPLHEITVANLEAYLGTFQYGWNRWSQYKRLRPFYKFARRRRWIAADVMAEIPIPKTPAPEREIYTVEQFSAMLRLAETSHREMLAYLVLSGFCFVRTSELVRKFASEQVLQWTDFHWPDRLIHVRPGVAKGTKRESDERYPPINDTALHWLEPIKRDTGDVVPFAAGKLTEYWHALTDAAGVPRIQNGLRHSCISYALAANPEHGIALVAQWAGSSEATVLKHYRRLLKPEQGRAWFAIGVPVKKPDHGIYVSEHPLGATGVSGHPLGATGARKHSGGSSRTGPFVSGGYSKKLSKSFFDDF
jgi:integrase